MRSDFPQVVIERPRYNSHYKYGNFRRRRACNEDSFETMPKRESMKLRFRDHAASKEFSDLISPLHRFLESNVGRPWNDVFSEIRKTIPNRGTINAHIYQHLYSFVSILTYINENGNVCCADGGRIDFSADMSGYNKLYVHPKTGILCRTKPYKKAPKKENPTYKKFGNIVFATMTVGKNQDQVWFRFDTKKVNLEATVYLEPANWRETLQRVGAKWEKSLFKNSPWNTIGSYNQRRFGGFPAPSSNPHDEYHCKTLHSAYKTEAVWHFNKRSATSAEIKRFGLEPQYSKAA